MDESESRLLSCHAAHVSSSASWVPSPPIRKPSTCIRSSTASTTRPQKLSANAWNSAPNDSRDLLDWNASRWRPW